ncbi:MAG: hypothetical protein R3F43_21620 [bacterium]
MPHKACFRCNLLFEAVAAHVGVAVPCPNCGQALEDYQVTEETPLEEPRGERTMLRVPGGQMSTTMFRLKSEAPRRHFDAPTQAIAVDQLDTRFPDLSTGSLEIPAPARSEDAPTEADRRSPGLDLEEAPTRALDARALRKAVTTDAEGGGRAGALRQRGADPGPRRPRDAARRWRIPTASARMCRRGPSTAACWQRGSRPPRRSWRTPPTRALDARRLRQAVVVPAEPAPVPGGPPPPPGGVQGVSGPVPRPRPRPPAPPPEPTPPPVAAPVAAPVVDRPSDRPAAGVSGPVPARRHRPQRIDDGGNPPQEQQVDPIPRPPPRPTPAPRSLSKVLPEPPPEPPAPRPVARPSAPRPAPPRAPEPDVPAYFDQSRVMDVPDAMGDLIAQAAPGPSVAPVERSTVIPPARTARRRRPVGLYLIGAVVLALAVGAIALVATRDTELAGNRPDGGASPGTVAAERPPWREALDGALARAQVRLPAARQGEPLDEAEFLVAGPDGLATSKGPVVGVMATPFPADAVEADEAGEVVRPLLNAFGRPEGERLTVALDRRLTARTVARVLYSGWKAGYRRMSLLLRQGDDVSGELVGLEVAPFRPGTPLPAAGGLVIRVGQLAINAVVEGRDGRLMGERPAPLPRAADGSLDLDALDALLDQLSSRHPRVRDAVVHVNGDLPLEPLLGVLTRVRGSDRRDRFPSIALAVQ